MSRPPRRTRLSIRARLTLLCLALFALAGTALMLLMNVLIIIELSQVYSRPPVFVDMNEPSPGDRLLQIKQADDDAADRAAHDIRVQSVLGFGVLTVLAGGLSWLVAGVALRPVRRITAVAGRLSQETLDERIAFAGPRDELRTLADSFDAMLDRLARAFDGQRLFVANASHELRTPLTVIRAAAEVTLARPARPETEYRHALAVIDGAAQRSERLLDSLLRLARTRHQRAHLQRLDLAEVARTAAGRLAGGPPPIHTELEPAGTTADPVLCDLLLRNLLDNAARYNVTGGWVRMRTRARDGEVVVTVENTGPLLTDEQAARLIRAFDRGGHDRAGHGDGFGLGLAIVEAIVHAHAGRLDVVPRPGGGLRVTVSLPAVDLADAGDLRRGDDADPEQRPAWRTALDRRRDP